MNTAMSRHLSRTNLKMASCVIRPHVRRIPFLGHRFTVVRPARGMTSGTGTREKDRREENNNDDDGHHLMTIFEVREHLMNMVGWRREWASGEEDKPSVRDTSSLLQHIARSQDELPKRRPRDSFSRAVIPLGRDPSSREFYLFFNRGLRFGRLLENFDTFAGLICYKHNMKPELGPHQKSPFAFVTAMVDRIVLSPAGPAPSPYKDILMSGQVTWVGRSSMECTMHMDQEHGGELQRLITATYLFVARTPKTDEAAVVNPLDPQTPEERQMFEKGELKKRSRQLASQTSLLKNPPTEDERLILHDIFLSTIDLSSGSFKTRIRPENTIWMDETKLKSLTVCHPEKRNLYNKIFGGFLMRKAYELAWTNVYFFAKTCPPMCTRVDDIVFLKPVEIGDFLFLSSQVVFTRESSVQMYVHAEVVRPGDSGSRHTTNNFRFTFDMGFTDVPRVLPKTYAESMLYLDGRRHLDT
ncbi:acyl-coenzyme A thioesterase 9, mitochondrial [Aplysia californica]|uniref:Acyl-coenzyme A thioesterase 9, mitochondrial n=1 Tax=Aplysia californica TaxID=6500 RepID=A0ABM0K7U8_APLCA|nr:acyl-coenzyme A thioesterase 9, mitochondrial [Aplysia californica]